jgi:hypothetical protein
MVLKQEKKSCSPHAIFYFFFSFILFSNFYSSLRFNPSCFVSLFSPNGLLLPGGPFSLSGGPLGGCCI